MPVRLPNFCDCCQGTPLYHVVLVASGAYTHESHRRVTNRKRVLKQLPSPGPTKRQQTTGAQSFHEGGLLVNHHDCGLRGRLLIKHPSWGCLESFPETSEGRSYSHAHLLTRSGAPLSPEGQLYTYLSATLVFMAATQGTTLDQLTLVATVLPVLGPTGCWQSERWLLADHYPKVPHKQQAEAQTPIFL